MNKQYRPTTSSTPITHFHNLIYAFLFTCMFLAVGAPSWSDSSASTQNAIVFIDSGLNDWRLLADGVLPGHEIVVLDENRPALEQMTNALQRLHRGGAAIESVHIVSHGKPGALVFASSEIGKKSIQADSPQLLLWNNLLTDRSTIYLYGCDVASGAAGEAFLTNLADLTGAGLAASADRTGASELGGDWDLEWNCGDIDSTPPFSSQAQAAYSHTLVADHTYGFGTAFVLNTPILTETVDGVLMTATKSDGGNLTVSSGFLDAGVIANTVTYTLTFSTGITITRFQLGEFQNNSEGTNYVFTPSSGTPITIADDSGSIVGAIATFNPTDWINVTSMVVSYAGASDWRVGVDNILFSISNHAPVLAGVDNTPTYTEGGSAVTLDGNATVNDTELDALNGAAGNYSGASLSLIRNGGANANDTFAIPTGGNLTVAGGPNGGGTITAGGNVMATIANASDDDEISITFTDANGSIPTTALVYEVMQAITYANSSDSPAASVQVNYTFSDGTASDTDDSITVTITEVNDIPTLTTFTTVLDTTNEDTEVEITLAELKAQGNEADVDGTVDGFVIKTVSTGSLKIGANSGAAVAFNAGVVDTVNAGNNAYWTPTGNANGTLNAFTAVAEDNDNAESASPIQATIAVSSVNDAPSLDNSKTPVLGAIIENSGAPSGVVGTLISSLVDIGGALSNVTDIDSSPSTGIAVVAADTTNGSWHYSTNNGTAWSALGTPSGPSSRLLAADANTRIYFQPNASYSGTVSGALTFRAWDTTNGSNGATVDTDTNGNATAFSTATDTASITVNALNDAPTLTAFSGILDTALEDTEMEITLAEFKAPGDEADSDGTVDAFVIKSVSNGTLKIGTSAGTAVAFAATSNDTVDSTQNAYWTPAANQNGIVVPFTTVAKDDDGAESSTAVQASVRVTAVNDAPSFTKGSDPTVNEDVGAQTVNGWATGVSAGPSDESSQVLTFNVTNTNNALFSAQPAIDSSGNLTYTPAANANGSATVNVTLIDSGGTANGGVDTSANQSFSITIDPINDAPSFTKGVDQNIQDNSGAQNVSGWATAISAGHANESGQILTFNVSNNNNSLFTVQPAIHATTGDLTYTPVSDLTGSAIVTVTLSDDGGTANGGSNTSASQTFTITIDVSNQAPTANNDAAETWIEHAITLNVLTNDTDSDSDTISIASYTQGSNGAVALNGSILTYTPNASFTGTDTFTYTIDDGKALYDNATVTITVYSLVTANAGSDQVDDIGDTIQLNASASGGDGSYAYTWTILSGSNTDLAQISDAAAANPTFLPTQTGDYVLEFSAADGITPTATDTVKVVMTHRPVGNDQIVTAYEDTPLEITLTGSDADGESLTFAIVGNPSKGTLSSLEANTGKVTYTPNLDYWGTDSFTFTVTDGKLVSTSKTVQITVENVDNDPPSASSVNSTTNEDTAVRITMQGYDQDGGVFVFDILSQPSHGRLSEYQNNNGMVRYTPNANFYGSDSFTYRAYDIVSSKSSAPATVSITVHPIQDAPTAHSANVSTDQNASIDIQLSGSDVDPEDSLRFSIVNGPAQGTISGLNALSGALRYSPNAGFSGSDSFTFAVSDGKAESTATVGIQVNAEPTPTATLTNTPVDEPSPTPTNTLVPTSTSTPSVKPTSTSTPVPSNTPKPTATKTNTPIPTNTAAPTSTHTPIPTSTFTPTNTATPTVKPTSTPTVEPTPTVTQTPFPSTPTRFNAIVTDDLAATADLSGGVDMDYSNRRILAIRWNYQAAGINDASVAETHVYVKENSNPTFSYLGKTEGGNQSSFEWKLRGAQTSSKYVLGPQFGRSYSFRIYALTKSGKPFFFGPFDSKGAVEFKNSIRITDDVDTMEDLSGGVDVDSSDRQRIVIRWNVDPTVMDITNIKWFHTYVSTDGSPYVYMGTTGNSTDEFFVWKAGGFGVKPAFINGPQFGHTYQFKVYALTLNLNPLYYGPFSTTAGLTYMGENGAATPTPTSTLVPMAPTPTVTPTPTPPEPTTPIANSVKVTDSESTFEDLSNGRDIDAQDDRGLTIRWTFSATDFPLDKLTDVHVYVDVDGSNRYAYLGRTADGTRSSFQWTPGAANLSPNFKSGPENGRTYTFRVYALALNALQRVYGPIHNAGPVEFVSE